MDSELLAALRDKKTMVFPKGSIILDFDKYIKQVPLLLKGSIKVVSEDHQGREITLYHIKPGESCVASILSAISQSTSKVKAVTIEESELYILDSVEMYDLIKNNPKWFKFFIDLYQTRFEELLEAVNRGSFQTHDEKVLELLRERSRLLNTMVIEITHKQIAEEFGTSREVISRVLKKLEQEKKLKIGRGKILLKPF